MFADLRGFLRILGLVATVPVVAFFNPAYGEDVDPGDCAYFGCIITEDSEYDNLYLDESSLEIQNVKLIINNQFIADDGGKVKGSQGEKSTLVLKKVPDEGASLDALEDINLEIEGDGHFVFYSNYNPYKLYSLNASGDVKFDLLKGGYDGQLVIANESGIPSRFNGTLKASKLKIDGNAIFRIGENAKLKLKKSDNPNIIVKGSGTLDLGGSEQTLEIKDDSKENIRLRPAGVNPSGGFKDVFAVLPTIDEWYAQWSSNLI